MFVKQMAILGVCLFLGFAHSLKAEAEISNSEGAFDAVEVCDAYLKLLEGESVSANGQCHELARFQIENYAESISHYLEKMVELAGEDSSLGAIALTMLATVRSDAINAFTWSELAARRVAIKLALSGDIERAALYSHLLSEIQRLSLVALCAPKNGCERIQSLSSIGEIFGQSFGSMDSNRSDILLLCLLRTDAFIVPVREVMKSEAFKDCVATVKGAD